MELSLQNEKTKLRGDESSLDGTTLRCAVCHKDTRQHTQVDERRLGAREKRRVCQGDYLTQRTSFLNSNVYVQARACFFFVFFF